MPIPHLLRTHQVTRLAEPCHSCHRVTQQDRQTAAQAVLAHVCQEAPSPSPSGKQCSKPYPYSAFSAAQTLLSSTNGSHFTPSYQFRCLLPATWGHFPP